MNQKLQRFSKNIMKKNWFNYILWVFTAIFVTGVFFLPETVPVHWNIQGVVDRYGSRYEYLIIVLLPLIIYYGMDFTKKIDPKYENIKKKEDIYEFFRVLMTLIFMAITIVLYFMSFEIVKINSSLLISCISPLHFKSSYNVIIIILSKIIKSPSYKRMNLTVHGTTLIHIN